MDPVGAPAPLSLDHTATHQRQSILGSFLRVRPRGSSQSHQAPPPLDHLSQHQQQSPQPLALASSNEMPNQPPSPSPGHRRRPAAAGAGGQLQPSQSHGFTTPSINPSAVHSFSHMLRRRRSANGALNSAPTVVPATITPASAPTVEPAAPHPQLAVRSAAIPQTQTQTQTQMAPSVTPSAQGGRAHRIRLVPHLDSNRSLHFEPIMRDVKEGDAPLRIGRFTDRSGLSIAALNAQNTSKLAFKSKVVSRAHAEVWCDPGGKFFIKDTKSSSGTFLNHIRLSAPNTESRPFPLKDGDVLQLGVDYQGGTEEIYKCVKMRIELGREWQAQANAFNTNAMKQLKALSAHPSGKVPTKGGVAKSGLSDCCICLFCVTVHQSLFIAPCSHVFHYKCIRPMLLQHHPGFSCPLCRTFADLEEDVEVEAEAEADVENENGNGFFEAELEGSVGSSEDNGDGSGSGGTGTGTGTGRSAGMDTSASALAPSTRVGTGVGVSVPMEVDLTSSVPPNQNSNSNANANNNLNVLTNAMALIAAGAGAGAGGAETEVERDRDFMPAYAYHGRRRVSEGTTLRNNNNNNNVPQSANAMLQRRRDLSPPGFDGVQEDVGEYGAVMMAETEAEAEYSAHLVVEEMEERGNVDDDEDEDEDEEGYRRGREHPLPPLPVPNAGMYSTTTTTGTAGTTGASTTNFRGQQGYGIMRPMSVPVSVHAMHMQGNGIGVGVGVAAGLGGIGLGGMGGMGRGVSPPPLALADRRMVVEEEEECCSDGEGMGFEVIGGGGSGSSGEGVAVGGAGGPGAGGKRKR